MAASVSRVSESYDAPATKGNRLTNAYFTIRSCFIGASTVAP